MLSAHQQDKLSSSFRDRFTISSITQRGLLTSCRWHLARFLPTHKGCGGAVALLLLPPFCPSSHRSTGHHIAL